MTPIAPSHRTEVITELEGITSDLRTEATFTYADLAQRLDVILRCIELWQPTDDTHTDDIIGAIAAEVSAIRVAIHTHVPDSHDRPHPK